MLKRIHQREQLNHAVFSSNTCWLQICIIKKPYGEDVSNHVEHRSEVVVWIPKCFELNVCSHSKVCFAIAHVFYFILTLLKHAPVSRGMPISKFAHYCVPETTAVLFNGNM